jgi:hypothetical protein
MRKIAAYLFGFGGRKSLVDATQREAEAGAGKAKL